MEDSPSKPSVAELAGRFKGHILPAPNDELPFRRKPPSSLKLHNQSDNNEESDKSTAPPTPSKIKMKNSAIFEKLQANLALSPTALLPSPKSPEVKLQPAPAPVPAPLSPTSPRSPLTPLSPTLRPSRQSSEEEDPVGFESPPEGNPLPSFNKTRARLSFKRRPPTRQHRRSAGEEAGAFGSSLSPCELYSPKENGDKDRVLDSPTEEAENEQLGGLKKDENKDEDCDKTEDTKVAQSDPDNREDPEEEGERGPGAEALEEDPEPSEPADVQGEEGQEELPLQEQRG
ncbi:capZ-interacting protein isoform X2 [Parambassis ranga]|uniref:CapZ-interacting protein isoform X2 n=1 Tax=Parambassis ranga TaxID=210632 RepID=A0A6P7JK70_9TELE|nr:capZ-interacting protein isoform X2 [Parambassis ranga]